MHSAAPSAAKLQTQIKPFFSVSPHHTNDPISSACTRTQPACSHQRGALILRARNRTLPPSCSGVTDTGRESRRRVKTQAAFRSEDKEELMRDRMGRAGMYITTARTARGRRDRVFYFSVLYVLGRKWRMATVSLLTVNVEREDFLSPLSPAPKFPEFFPVRLN